MSQHEHISIDQSRKYVFGWDQPLQSFFLQVHHLDAPEEEQIKVWLGTDPATQMYEVEDLVREAAKEDFDIPYRIQVELYGEKDDGR